MKNNNWSLLWEIPLAFLSFLFYKAMKFVIGNLFTVYLTLNKEKASQWRVLSAETLKSPLTLPVLMTKGPRWNTHAIIGTLGPFAVKQSIALDVESANNSAKSWIAVVYSFPDYKTIASIESGKSEFEDRWASLQLQPGKYTLGLRYYNWSEQVDLPAVKVDGGEFVNSQAVPSDINEFYRDLIQCKNWFYLGLHYYIFTLLRLRKWLPESLIQSEYLPVGAPDTKFFYGYLKRGQSLQVEVHSLIITNYDIYLTVYDRSSLPISWCQIKEEKQITQAIENNGFYLIRIRQKSPLPKNLVSDLPLECQLNNEDNLTYVSIQSVCHSPYS
ncbi:MAG: DUF6208 family protein [Xenococcaceae cyanobacterium]